MITFRAPFPSLGAFELQPDRLSNGCPLILYISLSGTEVNRLAER